METSAADDCVLLHVLSQHITHGLAAELVATLYYRAHVATLYYRGVC